MATKKSDTGKRWSKKRRAVVEEYFQEGKTPQAAAKAVELPLPMVKEYWNTLGEGESSAPDPEPKKKKQPAKKAKKGKKKDASPYAGMTKAQRIQSIIDHTNATLKKEVVRRASDSSTSYLLRRPSGIMSLDLALGGGYPAGALSVIAGPDGSGKDFQLNRVIAECQKTYGEDSAVAIYSTEFKYDKKFARDIAGVKVALTDDEIEEMALARETQGLPPLTDEEIEDLQTQIGEVALIEGVIAEDGLDVIIDYAKSNEFQVIVINSLGVLQTAAKESTDSLRDFAQQSNEAILLSKFMPQLFAALNESKDGRKNETCIIATDQVRANRDLPRMKPGQPIPESKKYKPGSGAWALKHGKAIELQLHKGTPYYDNSTKPPMPVGRQIKWELTKGKLGTHDGLKGSYDYFYEDGADLVGDLFNTAVSLGVIEKSGAWYNFEDLRTHGQEGMRAKLMQNPDVQEQVRESCIRAAEVVCRYK